MSDFDLGYLKVGFFCRSKWVFWSSGDNIKVVNNAQQNVTFLVPFGYFPLQAYWSTCKLKIIEFINISQRLNTLLLHCLMFNMSCYKMCIENTCAKMRPFETSMYCLFLFFLFLPPFYFFWHEKHAIQFVWAS